MGENGWYNATVFDNTIELTGCVSGRPCSMAGGSILFLGSTCALGETLGGLWEREEGRERVRRSMEAHTGHEHIAGIHTTMGGKSDRHFDLVWCTLKSPS